MILKMDVFVAVSLGMILLAGAASVVFFMHDYLILSCLSGGYCGWRVYQIIKDLRGESDVYLP